ncbi:MAG: CHAT domain-containing protein/Tfp pilus assembly protein PilF [Cyclobacteriaceae bacterium]
MKNLLSCFLIILLIQGAYSQDWLISYQNSVIYYNNFESDKARDEALKALELYKAAVASQDKNLGAILRQLSVIYYDLNALDASLDYAKQEVTLLQTINLAEDMNFANSLQNLALIRMNRSEYVAAEPLLKKALTITTTFHPLESYEVGTAKGNLAIASFQLKKDEEALALFEESMQILASFSEVGPEYYNIVYNYASLLTAQTFYEKALAQFQVIEEYYNYETPNFEYGSILIKVGDMLDNVGKFDQSVTKYRLAVDNFSQMGELESAEYSIALNNLTLALQKIGEFDEARTLMDGLLIQKKANKEAEPETYATTLASYANLLIRNGEPEKAENSLLDALEVYATFNIEKDLTYVNVLESLSSINQTNGNFALAKTQVKEALSLTETNGYKAKEYSLFNLNAKILAREGKFEEARKLAEKSLTECQSRFGEDAIQTCFVKNSLAGIVAQLGEYDRAEALYQEIMPIFSQTYGGVHPESAKVLANYSSLLQLKGNYYTAEYYLKKSLNIKKQVYGEQNPDYLATYENLALLYQQTARFTSADQILEEIKTTKESILLQDDPSLAYTYMNLGGIKKEIADYTSAENYFRKARDIFAITVGNQHVFYAAVLDNLALLYQKMGNTAAAKPLFKEALAIYESNLGKLNIDYATATENLATIYKMEDNLIEAKKLLEEVLIIDEQILGTEHPLYSKTLHNLAAIYESNQEFEKAEELYLKALAIDEKVFGANHPSYASTLYNLAVLEQELEKYDLAMKYFREVVDIRKSILGETHPDYVFSLYGLAHILHRTGDFEGAMQPYQAVIDEYLDQINAYFPALSESEKSAFYGKIRPVIEAYLDFGVEFVLLSKGSAQDRDEMIGSLYNLQLATKALLLNASNKVRNRINSSGNQALIDLFNDWIALKENIVKAYAMSKDETLKAEIDIPSMEREVNDKEKQLSQKSSEFAAEFEKKQVTWEQVKAKLGPEAAAIEIIRIKKKIKTDSVIYVSLILDALPGSSPKIVVNGNGIEMESKGFKAYKNSIIYKVADSKSYRLFWSSIDKVLDQQVKEIFLSADGVYNKVNTSTLLDTEKKEYVLDKYSIRLLSNTRELVENTEKQNPTNKAMLFGFPKYNMTAAELANTTAMITDADTRYSFGSDIAELPGTLEEINNIEIILKANQWDYDKYLSTGATEDQIKKVQSPKILHIATHGFFLADIKPDAADAGLDSRSTKFNPLLRSGLLLAGAENTMRGEGFDGNEDGILTAYEAMNLNLDNTDIVIMSACETGLGEVKNGEGVYGLQRSFIVAGASNLVMSLWKVNDATTQLLMTNFYKNWFSGQPKLEAFNNAIQEVRANFKEPYYWGAFVILGN